MWLFHPVSYNNLISSISVNDISKNNIQNHWEPEKLQISVLVQNYSISSALAMEILQFSTKQSVPNIVVISVAAVVLHHLVLMQNCQPDLAI